MPFTFSTPATTGAGCADMSTGGGFVTVNCSGAETRPLPVMTVMLATPALTRSAPGTVAVRLVPAALAVVARAVPFHWTLAAVPKRVPVTTSCNEAPVASADWGFKAEMTGSNPDAVRARVRAASAPEL